MNPLDPPEAAPELFPSRPAPAPAPVAQLAGTVEMVQEHTEDMRRLLHAAFVAVIVLALGVNLFLWKQMRIAGEQLERERGEMERAEAAFRKRDPEFRRIINALLQFASTHPDYGEILARYRAVLPQYLPTMPALSAKPDPAVLPPPGR